MASLDGGWTSYFVLVYISRHILCQKGPVVQKLVAAMLLAAFACSLQACTAKGSNLTPLVSQSHQLKPMDTVGGGPSQNCGDQACPDPTPTP